MHFLNYMLSYIRFLFQLVLAPTKGWEDISASGKSYSEIQTKGYFPLIILTALCEFIPLIYSPSLTFVNALENVIAIGGGLYVSIYAARLFLDIVLTRFIDAKMNILKINILAIYMLGLDCLYRILANLIPASMTFLSFLPLISIIILFKSAKYLYVPDDRIINYLAISFTGVVIIPASVCALLMLII